MADKPPQHRDIPSKRSKIVALSLMGAGVGAIVLAELWPSSPPDVPVDAFQNLDACVNSGRYDRSICERAFAEAARHHDAMAPRYATAADCEADFTPAGCAPLPTSPSGITTPSFAPVVAGVLLGSAVGAAAGATATMPQVQPLYRSCTADPRDNCSRTPGTSYTYLNAGLYTCSGYRVGNTYGSAHVQPVAFSTAGASTTTMSRGGFGTRARAMSAAS